ncbi:hypothetical protein FEDK69T_30630 [Flavobacterium enshiense DK69]|uniref:DUF4890 domain-containing protein n=1 Tax=Flavobacterium enshiense DK69 TaxID=1107311 RepID=V6S0L2_9FLAO|nr:hypothetical protein [Flavobacterium enshiense]ESU19807.1 hypothetical protein FEDK69T_30630 [Flavobacterium enshiense DK69]KGO93106.1 hypothetical protein Q767_15100 [Flavobacterium enshiense DK69]
MKKIIIAVLSVMLLTVVNVNAQSKNAKAQSTPEQRAEKLTTWMKDNLNLTAEQIPLVQELNLKYARLNEELKNMSGPRNEKMKKIKSNETAKEEELKKILTPEQFQTYTTKKREVKEEVKTRYKEKNKSY